MLNAKQGFFYSLRATLAGGSLFGGPEEIRTPDPYNANVMRSQLRYGPICSNIICPENWFVKDYMRPPGRACKRKTHEKNASFLYLFFEISD